MYVSAYCEKMSIPKTSIVPYGSTFGLLLDALVLQAVDELGGADEEQRQAEPGDVLVRAERDREEAHQQARAQPAPDRRD